MNPTGCPDFEVRIADGSEGQLPPGDSAVVEQHLAGCPACREFARRLRALDAALVHAVKAPELPASFNDRLWARIQTEAPDSAEARRVERRQRLQAEYEAGLTRMRRRFRSFSSVLDTLGLGFLAASAVTAAVVHAPKLIQALPAEMQGRFDNPLLVGAVIGAGVVLAGALAICRRPHRLSSLL